MKIVDLEINLKNYKEALFSNKGDTSNLLILLGEAAEKAAELETRIVNLETRLKRNFWFNTIGITVASGVVTGIGAIEYYKGNTFGRGYMWTGLGLFVGGQLIYQSGHWVFRWW